MNRVFRPLLVVVSLGLLLPAGCGKFFVDPNGINGTTTCTNNCVYVANNGNDDIAAFAATNPLSLVSSVNVGISDVAITMAVTPDNQFLFAGSSLGNIYMLPVQSGGSLGSPTTAASVSGAEVRAITVDPAGANLLAAVAIPITPTTSCSGGFIGVLNVYTISSSGGLTLVGTQATSGPCGTPTSIAVSPNGNFAFMGLGATGVEGFTYVSSTGVATEQNGLSILGSTTTEFNGVAIDTDSTYLFVTASGTSGGITEYLIKVSGTTYSLQQEGSTEDSGGALYPVVVDPMAANVYAGDFANGEVYGYSYGSTGLTAISGSPFSPSSSTTGMNGMAIDSSGSFVFTVNQTGPNLQEFAIGTSGGLTASSASTTSTGTYTPESIALTH
jgi:6-phosphogluconolactonase (cycloisomerase 2 family)